MIDQLQAPRTPDPQAAPPLRWGVLGTGWVAERFTTALHASTAQRMVAVASRDTATAERFAARAGVAAAYGDYEALVAAPDVDIVYVATPHQTHRDLAMLAIGHGKHVLVEKPLALDAQQGREIAAAAAAAGVFCMEALWTLFLPKYDVVRQVVQEGLLGELRTAVLDHGEWFAADHRIHRADLAGGSLLDLASYTVAVADDLLGPAEVLSATADLTDTGVEGQVATIARHDSGAIAMHHSTILTDTPVRAVIAGTEGLLELEPPFWGPGDLRLHTYDGAPDRRHREPSTRHAGLYWQAAEVARRIADGDRESPLRPLESSVRCLAVLDAMRALSGAPSLTV